MAMVQTGSPDDEKEPIDPAVPKAALTALRKIIHGNGLDPRRVSQEHFEGETLNFEAFQIYTIETRTSEQHVRGRQKGETCGSAQDMRAKIQAYINKITHDLVLQKNTINLLKKRPDLGFHYQNMVIPLDSLARRFVVHEACTQCDTRGHGACNNCHGHRTVQCHHCRGRREIPCRRCHSTGLADTPQGKQKCPQCRGRRFERCRPCAGKGKLPCHQCKGKGTMSCQNCGGGGWFSHLGFLQIKASGRFDYDRNSIPSGAAELIDRLGGAVVTDKHAQVRIDDDMRRHKELDARCQDNEYMVPYQVKLPWAEAHYLINGETETGYAFGYNGFPYGYRPFLEDPTRAARDNLAKAASGQGAPGAALSNAAKTRLIAESLVWTAKAPITKAAALIARKYPVGLDPDTPRTIAEQADRALDILLKKPRTGGIIAGTIAALLLYGGYYIAGHDALAAPYVNDTPLAILESLAMVGLGAFMAATIIHLMVVQALGKTLGALMKKRGEALKPKWQKDLIWGLGAALLGYGIFIALSLVTGSAHIPLWLT